MKSIALLSILVIASLAPALWVLTRLSCFVLFFFGYAGSSLLRGLVASTIWDLLRPGIEPVSPALAGQFFTTDPPEALHRASLWSEAETFLKAVKQNQSPLLN